ncbi:MAG: carbohydrate ABC transporter permease [Thermoanaerobacterium sp.]|nr:carbohydrate ABC transporter permease [Thermoanaerobacterium sp.]
MLSLSKGKSLSDVLFDAIVYLLCALIFLVIAYPVYFVVIASISDANLVAQGHVTIFPKGVSLFGYQKVFEDERIWIGYRNTIIYTILGTTFSMILTLPAAYSLSRPEFRARRFIMFFFAFTMFFNGGLIPTYILIKNLGLDNTIWVFVIPFAVNVYNLIVTRSFFENSIPKELYESATLDGCSHFRFFTSIVLPLSNAIISVIALYYIVAKWNDFFTGLIYIRDKNLVPLQLVLRDILIANQVFKEGVGLGGEAGGYAQRYADAVKYAIIIVSTLPVIVFYPFVQKYFEKGVMIGAIKG